MSSLPRIAALSLLAAASTGCGDFRLIGRAEAVREMPPPGECGARFELHPMQLAAESEVDRCELFSLEALQAAGDQDKVYVTGVEAMTTTDSVDHHLDVRIAPAIDGEENGEVPCARIFGRMVSWIPLMATQRSDSWDLSSAPLVTARRARLLINHHAVNMGGSPVDLAVTLTLHCAPSTPAVVSQAFEFTDRKQQTLFGHSELTAGGTCVFSKAVGVSRLYRRTHLITAYSVERPGQAEPLWASDEEWKHDFMPPVSFLQGEGLKWECDYLNEDDVAIMIGGSSSDSCSLLGIYQLPEGGEDDSPERCTLGP